jgi:hypothetical protein
LFQVPDDILSLLNDPYLFANNGEITTKEILKRFQDRKGQVSIADHEVYNKQESSSRPPARRIDTDPSVWKGETTVRPVQDVPRPFAGHGQGTPPQRHLGREDGPYPSPYRNQQYNHSDSQIDNAEQHQRREWRNSGWGRQGGLGVGNS